MNLDELASKFFREFARMEYALKASGFHNVEGEAKPNWDKFASSIRGKLEADPEIVDAIAYMIDNPPKKQVVRGGQFSWDSVERARGTTLELTRCIRRVRNNLFHGGKFNGRWFEPERSEPLIRHSLSILESCLRASPEVRDAFYS